MDELIGRKVIISARGSMWERKIGTVRARVEQAVADRPRYQVEVEGFLLELSAVEFRIR